MQIMGIGGGFRNNIGELRGGHIAFCESPTEFASRTGYVALLPRTRLDNARFFMTEGETRNEQGRIHRGGVDVTEEVVARVPRGALTMGVSTILNAKKCLQVAYGQHKAEILVASIEGEVTPNIPASFLQKHTNVVILLDKDAASKLTLEPVWKKTEHA